MTPTKHLFILRELSPEELEKICQQKGEIVISSELNYLPYYHKFATFTFESQAEAEKESFDIVRDFGHRKFEGKTVIEHLTYENSTYWYYLKFSLFGFYNGIHLERKKIDSFISLYKPTELEVYSKENHELGSMGTCMTQEIMVEEKSSSIFSKMGFFKLFMIRFWFGLNNNWKIKKGKNAIIQYPHLKNEILDINNPKEKIIGDYISEYFLLSAKDCKNFIFLSDFYPPKNINKLKYKKEYCKNDYFKKTLYFEPYFLGKILNPKTLFSLWRMRKNLKSNISHITSSTTNEYDKNILKFINSKINLLLLMKLRVDTTQWLCKKKDIKSVTCYDEYTYNNYSIINGAKSANIKTIAFQHGIVHPFHINYMFSKLDVPYNPIPDYTFLWGENWKKIMMTESIYAENSLLVLGQIRTDIIPKLKKLDKKNGKKTIVFATQPNDIGLKVRKELANHFIKLSNKYHELNFVIRPHPNEKDAEILYTQIGIELGTINFRVIRDELYSILNECDLLITFNSTVASEAIYFKKPVLILDYYDNDVVNYQAYKGAVFSATNFGEFDEVIGKLNDNSLIVDETEQNKFIEDFVHKIDGKVAKNYITTIEKLASKVF